MENLTVRYRASPTPARSEPWRPLWIPRGHLQKTLVFLVFLRRRLWNSAGGHSPHDANLTLIVKIRRLSPNPYKIGKSGGFNRNLLCRPDPGAKRAVAPPLDPTRPTFKNIGFPCVSEAPPLESCWRPQSPRCRCHAYRQKDTLIAEPL